MNKILCRRRPALGGAVVCLLAVASCWPDAPATSASERPVPAIAAVSVAQPSATVLASPNRAPSLASEAATRRIASTGAHPTGVPRTTSTTIMGGGSPSTWPAARAVAPSLAGAYSPNLKTAFVALVNYWDWLGSHPKPNLVKNFAEATSNIYAAQVYLMGAMDNRGWHLPPNPTQVDFLYVVQRPVPTRPARDHSVRGYRVAYSPGAIYAVINQITEPYLNERDQIVGHTGRGTGETAWRITLLQNRTDGRFRIGQYQRVLLRRGIQVWERSLVHSQ